MESYEKLSIGMMGVALSHPYTFTEILQERGVTQVYAWDDNPSRLQAFCATYPHVQECNDFETILQLDLDGVMVCNESHLHAAAALPFIERGIPVFIDKVMAIDETSLVELERAAVNAWAPVFSSSILRFSPRFIPLYTVAKRENVLWAGTTIYHSIEAYLNPGNTWQDELDKGGGTLINMGVHGVELLFAACGDDVRSVFAIAGKRRFAASQSEDVAILHLTYADGLTCSVQLVGASSQHGYQMQLITTEETQTVYVPGADDVPPRAQYGYDGLVDAFLTMVVTGREPVPFTQTAKLMRVLQAARRSAQRGCWIDM